MAGDKADISALNREKTGIARLSIISNIALVSLKLAVGLIIGSVSVISEAIHLGIDLVAAAIEYYSMRQSTCPANETYALEHGKVENFSGAIEAVFIFIAAAIIIKEAYDKLAYGIIIEDAGPSTWSCLSPPS